MRYIQVLDEFNAKQMKDASREIDKDRASHLLSYFRGSAANGDLMFKTMSGTHPGHYWYQIVRFKDLYDLIVYYTNGEYTDRQLTNLLLTSDIKVACNCPWFLYGGFRYITWQLSSGVDKENRAPNKKNPNQKGFLCKHLISVLSKMPFMEVMILSAYKRKGVL